MRKILLISLLLLMQWATAVSQVQPYHVTVYDSSKTAGYYFLVPTRVTNAGQGFHAQMILDRFGELVYYRPLLYSNGSPDFKVQKNGMISYFLNLKYYILDSTFTVVDSVACKNGISTDEHEMQILPNGNFLILGYESVFMNLSAIDWFKPAGTHGSSVANVKCVVIQEQDPAKNVVFEWHSKDYFAFTDADSLWFSNPNNVDWTHSNALDLDNDGNILLSTRHFDEITKINRLDSSIIWRFGGKQNQFTLLNDTIPFYGQHYVRRNTNGNLTLFDNGFRVLTAPYHGARALEYQLDEVNKTAALVWGYVYDSTMYSRAMGNVQRQPNGNTLVNFGFNSVNNVTFVVVDSMKNKVFELFFPDSETTYRAFNFQQLPWMFHRPEVSCFDSAGSYWLAAAPGQASYEWNNGDTNRIIQVTAGDTFFVWVPYGGKGFISSERFIVTDMLDPCNTGATAIPSFGNNEFEIYPNPAGEKLYINWLSGINNTAAYSLYNVLGEKIMTGELSTATRTSVIDISSLPRGLYVIEISSSGKTSSVKVMKD
jgi:hypothetical protein